MGDRYLEKIAETISAIGMAKSVAARHGGDEFVLLYGYSAEAEVLRDLETLRYLQKNTVSIWKTGR